MVGTARHGVSVASVAIDCNALLNDMRKAVSAEKAANDKAINATKRYGEALDIAAKSTERRTEAYKRWDDVWLRTQRSLPQVDKAWKEWEDFSSKPAIPDIDDWNREMDRRDRAINVQKDVWNAIDSAAKKIDVAEGQAAKDDLALQTAKATLDRYRLESSYAATAAASAIAQYRAHCQVA